MRRRVPVWVTGHVAVSRHVYSFRGGWDVPDRRNGWRARRQGDGAGQSVTLVRVTALFQQLLELGSFVLKPYLYLKRKTNKNLGLLICKVKNVSNLVNVEKQCIFYRSTIINDKNQISFSTKIKQHNSLFNSNESTSHLCLCKMQYSSKIHN